ncbi:S8 family peptidase [Streptomyces buecherae]|uniref:S8 family peptidase n=1 Tax=Streptomyces buecherae TaxID=2763006 RepID=A0A7H8N2V3_9ACTN|nr:S8 family peptidase [Streptomyces buecherae]QKW48775.1 S8 family peptidase [Streptomyces buecherae]
MKRSRLAAVLLATPLVVLPAATGAANAAPSEPSAPMVAVQKAAPGQAVQGSYIVTLKSGVTAKSLTRAKGLNTQYVYSKVLNGFAARLTAGQLSALRANPAVQAIEENQKATVSGTQNGATWGLDRIDQRNRPLDSTYTWNRDGAGVTAYIIDTGLDSRHADFGGRAQNVYNSVGGSGEDCHGHGTHVGGTVGGDAYGVAKGVALRGVKVLGCDGSGSFAGIIAGFDWVRANAAKPAVANASLGGGYSAAVNTAAANLANSGVHLSVAAGNDNRDACNYSPASASSVLTVAASDSSDRKASFSNYGRCVETYAPGVSITSARMGGGSTSMNGTSMASPHAAGVAALYKANNGDASSATINSWVTSNATPDVITGNVTGTPNRLLFKAGL